MRAEVLTGAEYERAIEDESDVKEKQSRRSRKETVKNFNRKDKFEESFKEAIEGYTKCEEIINLLNKHPLAKQFFNLNSIPTYPTTQCPRAIPNMIDLNTLEQRLKAKHYTTTGQFIEDGRKIWVDLINVAQYNVEFRNACLQMANYFESIITGLGNVPLSVEYTTESKTSKGTSKSIGRGRKPAIGKPMTAQEKSLLRTNVMLLTQDKLQGVIEIIKSAVDTNKSQDTVEFDIDKLPVSIARKLDAYVKEHLPATKKTLTSGKRRNVSLLTIIGTF